MSHAPYIWIGGLSVSIALHISLFASFPSAELTSKIDGHQKTAELTFGNAISTQKIGALPSQAAIIPPISPQNYAIAQPVKTAITKQASLADIIMPTQSDKLSPRKISVKKPVKAPKPVKKIQKKKPPVKQKTKPEITQKTAKKTKASQKTVKIARLTQQAGNKAPKNSRAGISKSTSTQKLAHVAEGQSKSAHSSNGLDSQKNYLGKVQRQIHNHPRRRQRRGGEVIVKFTLDSSGLLESLSIQKSSGNKRLDKVALAHIEKAGPYPAFPENMTRKNWTFTMPITFQKR